TLTGGAISWPADPLPIALKIKIPVPIPALLWSPKVSLAGFGNPFPDSSQCTWFAYQAYAAFDHRVLDGVRGDAGDWAAEVRGGAQRDRLLAPGMANFGPVPGAVIILARSSGMPHGHVGIIRATANDQQGALWMLLWDANWDLRGGRMQHWEAWRSWQGRTAGFLLPPISRADS
ncbi:MAG: CHAP domain-containing protein, partial [Candidatus Dormibacteraceae bacterium]